MNNNDPALTCPNPRLIAAIYFGLLSVVGTILINAFLTSLGIVEQIRVHQSIILGMLVSSCAGAVMGERIIHSERPYKLKTFLIGFSMVIASLPIFDLGLVFFMFQEKSSILYIAQLHNMVYLYLYILAYSYILFGIVLAIGSGLAAMFLRGQLVYDILSTYQPNEQIEKLPESPIEKNKIEHSDRVRITHR